jgi:cysteinyl-tRNA synthetase
MPKLRLYNTLTRKLETFDPFNSNLVKVYTCGPTVYSQPHVGNFAAYVYWDLMVRTLEVNDYKVERVINLTDVGHLVSDGDDGEDKLEKGARKSGKTVWEVAEYYISAFQKDFRRLQLREPTSWARATDYINEDIAIVNLLAKKGYTYETTDGVYFDTSKFEAYADFAKLQLDQLRAGARVEFSNEKKNPSDFAVWKFIQPYEQHTMRWDYLGRPGYPGWHLECSTIIHNLLGETIDIHTGGIDHIPVHHTNEIAQSEAAFDKKLAKYWLHCNFLTVDGEKISKSLGNIYTIDDLVKQGYSPLDFKMWVLQGHYQTERDFSLEQLESARVRRLNWRNRIALCHQGQQKTVTPNQYEKILAALDDNLNSPQAFAAIDEAGNGDTKFWQYIDKLFGLNLLHDAPALTDEQEKLIKQRASARNKKDFARSDELRQQLTDDNISISDTPDGQVWGYVR